MQFAQETCLMNIGRLACYDGITGIVDVADQDEVTAFRILYALLRLKSEGVINSD